jgi:hypothetical protein
MAKPSAAHGLLAAPSCALHPAGCAWLGYATADAELLTTDRERFDYESPRRRRMGDRAARLAGAWRNPARRAPEAPSPAERHLAEHLAEWWRS